jgi:hypothetical protein
MLRQPRKPHGVLQCAARIEAVCIRTLRHRGSDQRRCIPATICASTFSASAGRAVSAPKVTPHPAQLSLT